MYILSAMRHGRRFDRFCRTVSAALQSMVVGSSVVDRPVAEVDQRHDRVIPTMRLYIGNLPYSVDDSSLTQTFAQFGEVANATVIMDRMTGRSKGFGFVEMPNDAEAEGAIKALDNSDMDGRNIKVNVARPREERAPRRPRY